MTSDHMPAESILFVGDIHAKAGRVCPVIERHLGESGARTVVLLGDMLNDWNVTAREEVEDFTILHGYVRKWGLNGVHVIVLLGNHDVIYTLPCDSPEARRLREYSPGYNRRAHADIRPMLMDMLPQIAYGFTLADGRQYLCSHAGFTTGWLNWMWEAFDHLMPVHSAEDIAGQANRLFQVHPALFLTHVGRARGGDWDTVISPLWLDRSEASVSDVPPEVRQIVGHTPVPTVTTSGLFTYCDTMSTMSDGTRLGDWSMLLYDAGENVFRRLEWPEGL